MSKPTAKQLRGARIYFDISTVGGTEHLMMTAALAKGETILENAAREPEIAELAEVLTKMGAQHRRGRDRHHPHHAASSSCTR